MNKGKKNFKTTFNDLLGGGDAEEKSISKEKEIFEETKATFVVRIDQLDKLKAISYMERKMIKNVLEEALAFYISKYEKENGGVVLPKNK